MPVDCLIGDRLKSRRSYQLIKIKLKFEFSISRKSLTHREGFNKKNIILAEFSNKWYRLRGKIASKNQICGKSRPDCAKRLFSFRLCDPKIEWNQNIPDDKIVVPQYNR